MASLLTDELWTAVAPLLPAHPPSPKGGKPRRPDRDCLAGILFLLKTGCAWQDIPTALGASGTTCWRRQQEWAAADVWAHLHQALLAHLRSAGALDLSRVVVDSAAVRAVKVGPTPAATRPTAASAAASGTC